MSFLCPFQLGALCHHNTHVSHVLITTVTQEFISICEALELISEDELEISRQKQPDTMANRRAQKVSLGKIFFLEYVKALKGSSIILQFTNTINWDPNLLLRLQNLGLIICLTFSKVG